MLHPHVCCAREWQHSESADRDLALRVQNYVSLKIGGAEVADGQSITLEEAIGRDDMESLAQKCVDFLATIPYLSTFWAQLRGVDLQLAEPIVLGPLRLRAVGPELGRQPQAFANALVGGGSARIPLAANDIVMRMRGAGRRSWQVERTRVASANSTDCDMLERVVFPP